ncbi:MAG: hypothetical protein KJO07_23610 [Deltaproteobacteria bacterium]|nr:hypothetical protein [Deltaproteobacteria bacterium]
MVKNLLLIALMSALGCGRAGFDEGKEAADAAPRPDADVGLAKLGDQVGCRLALEPSSDGADALLSWIALPEDDDVGDVYFARVNVDGQVVVGPNRVGGAQLRVGNVAVHPTSYGYVVFFESSDALWMNRLDESGETLEAIRLATSVDYATAVPTALGFNVIWQETASGLDLISQPFDQNGNALAAAAELDTSGEDPVAVATTQGTLVAFSNRAPESAASLLVDDMAQAIDARLEQGTTRVRQTKVAVDGTAAVIADSLASNERQPALSFVTVGVPLAEAAPTVDLGPKNRLEWSRPAVAFWQGQLVAVRIEDSSDPVPRVGRYVGAYGAALSGPTMLTDGSRRAVCLELVTLNDGVLMAWTEVDFELATRTLRVANVTP